MISFNDLKTDSENDNEKARGPSFSPPKPAIICFDDLDFFKDFDKEFPAIVYNDALTSKLDFLTEPTLSPQHIDEFDLKDETSLFECDKVEQNVLYLNDLFPFNTVYTAYPNPMDTTYQLSGHYPVFIFSTVYTAYSLNEYSVFDTGPREKYRRILVENLNI
ncbi:reverse transcriptase domain-containing protein [Tanacetum coccineum]